jgi:hypothetical protein
MYDIVFISYNETQAEENWSNLKDRFPYALRVHGVKGIHQAHIAAANLAITPMVYIVDADAIVLDDFDFSYVPSVDDQTTVHVYTSINPINGLEYGNGGVKLFPRLATVNMDTTTNDMSTSISNKFKVVDEISNIAAFNVDEFSTWRSAFRECAKLSSKTIKGQVDDETEARLKIWTTVGKDKPFGEYCINGACAGMEFGLSSGADLNFINDFDWLKRQFNA